MEVHKTLFDELHITVGAAVSGNIDISQELRLIKAALLYADRVKVCSLTSSMLITILPLVSLTEDQAIEALEQWIPILQEDMSPSIGLHFQHYKELKKKKHRSKKELILLFRTREMLLKFRKEIGRTSEKMLIDAGIEGLINALQTGLVEIQLLDVNSDGLVEDFFENIKAALLSGETYPLFDDQTGHLVDAAIQAGKLDVSTMSTARAKQVGLSSGLFERLPLFDNASIDEIVDIRKELNTPLIRFRSAIIEFSRSIGSASWEREFPLEIEQVFREKVEPAVLEIEEATKSNQLLFKLIKSLADKPLVLPSTSALGVLISQASLLPEIVAQSFALSAGGAVVALDAYKDWSKEKLSIEKNQLYFYYRVKQSLK